MRLLAIALLLGLAGCPPSKPPARPQPTTGPLAMIEASPDLDGRPIGTSDARATIVVLMASWCGHCRAQLAQLADLRAAHPHARIVGINYRVHEEYDDRDDAQRLRAYVAEHAPWLRVVPAGEQLFGALGRPPFVPAVWVFDARGELVTFFDRRERAPPTREELTALLAQLGA
jgi:thiol-disulfide isomerase/thioredoxin